MAEVPRLVLLVVLTDPTQNSPGTVGFLPEHRAAYSRGRRPPACNPGSPSASLTNSDCRHCNKHPPSSPCFCLGALLLLQAMCRWTEFAAVGSSSTSRAGSRECVRFGAHTQHPCSTLPKVSPRARGPCAATARLPVCSPSRRARLLHSTARRSRLRCFVWRRTHACPASMRRRISGRDGYGVRVTRSAYPPRGWRANGCEARAREDWTYLAGVCGQARRSARGSRVWRSHGKACRGSVHALCCRRASPCGTGRLRPVLRLNMQGENQLPEATGESARPVSCLGCGGDDRRSSLTATRAGPGPLLGVS